MRIPMESSFLIKRNYDLVVVIVVDISRVRFVIVLDASDDRLTATTARAQHETSRAKQSRESIATMSKAQQSKAKYSKAKQS
jgi:hypothetical protein